MRGKDEASREGGKKQTSDLEVEGQLLGVGGSSDDFKWFSKIMKHRASPFSRLVTCPLWKSCLAPCWNHWPVAFHSPVPCMGRNRFSPSYVSHSRS